MSTQQLSAITLTLALAVSALRAQAADPTAKARQLLAVNDTAAACVELEHLALANPYSGWCWGRWGYCLHAGKLYEQAIPCYRKAVELGHNPAGNLYNAACAEALLGHRDAALNTLAQALGHRFADQETLTTDHDLDSLRTDPRFAALTGVIAGLPTPLATTREARWAWDLDFCIRRMQQMHWNLYGNVTTARLGGEIEALKAAVGKLSDHQVRARLRRIVALVGDGHTAASLVQEGAERVRLPLHLFAFRDGLHVIGADKAHAELVGARIHKVGPLDADAALGAVRPFVSADNTMGYLDSGPAMLTVPVLLQEIGAADDESGVTLMVSKDGQAPRNVRVAPAAIPVTQSASAFSPSLIYGHQQSKTVPLYLRHADRNLHVETAPEHKLVYFWFGAIEDDPDLSIAALTQRLIAEIASSKAERLVIDMRWNGGGDTGLVPPLVTALAECKAVNRRGHLFVIIGRRTFSAAQNTVNMLAAFTKPIFVGEPTGSRPRFVGESTWFVLPHSQTRIYCSSRYWQVLDSTDDRCWIPPDIVAEPTAADYFAGRDPAMTAILAAIGG